MSLSSLHNHNHTLSHSQFSSLELGSLSLSPTLCGSTKLSRQEMTSTAGQRVSSTPSFSHPRPSTLTKMAPPPATLQPDLSFTFPVPYLPTRIPLSPPPYRTAFIHTISTFSSPAVSPTTTTRPKHCLLATPFFPGSAPRTTLTNTSNTHGLYERPGRCSNCVCHPRPSNEAKEPFPWKPIAWNAINQAEREKSLAYSADPYVSCTSGGPSSSRDQPKASSQPSRGIFLEQWLREQARFHACDGFVNQTDFVRFEDRRDHCGYPGPRLMPLSEVSRSRRSEAFMGWTKSDE